MISTMARLRNRLANPKLASVWKSFTRKKYISNIKEVKCIHGAIEVSGLKCSSILQQIGIMYRKSNDAEYSKRVFQETEKHMITVQKILDWFKLLNKIKDVEVDPRSWKGLQVIHGAVITSKIESRWVDSQLINFYGKGGDFKSAIGVFQGIVNKELITWNTMMSMCSKHGYFAECFSLFGALLKHPVEPDSYTFTTMMHCCSMTGKLNYVMDIHKYMIIYGILPNPIHYNCIIDCYSRNGALEAALSLVLSTEYFISLVKFRSVELKSGFRVENYKRNASTK